jgi:hypothetical protein
MSILGAQPREPWWDASTLPVVHAGGITTSADKPRNAYFMAVSVRIRSLP